MTSYTAGLGVPIHPTRLSSRLHQRFSRLAGEAKARGQLADSLPLAPGERILANTLDDCGRRVAASDRALYHCKRQVKRAPMPEEWIRLGWEEIAHVSWDEDVETLTLWGLLPVTARHTVLHLPTGASLALLAQERLGATALVRTNVDLGQHGSTRVIGRRRPATDEVVWLVGLDGAAPGNADMQKVLDAALADLRAQLGV